MSFLHAGFLWALPLVLVPLVIHWLHRRRQPSITWAATIFITRARRSRGSVGKLWRYLILAARTLVVGALVVSLARPLSISNGSWGWVSRQTGGDALTLVLVDRSPSMQRRWLSGGETSGQTRLDVALGQVAETIEVLGGGRVVLIDSVHMEPIELASADRLRTTPFVAGCDASADVLGMLFTAADYLDDVVAEVADVWVISDQQRHDWAGPDSKWTEIDQRYHSEANGLQLHLIEFPSATETNTSVRVTKCDWQPAGQQPASQQAAGQQAAGQGGPNQISGVRLSLQVERTAPISSEPVAEQTISVSIEIAGNSQVVEIPIKRLNSAESKTLRYTGRLEDYFVAIRDRSMAWGAVSIAADRLPNDDRSYFSAVVDSGPTIRLTLREPCQALRVAAEVLGKPSIDDNTIGETSRQPVERSRPALWIWQGELPNDQRRREVEAFVRSGGQLIFFPSVKELTGKQAVTARAGIDDSFGGFAWGTWTGQQAGESQTQWDDWRLELERFCEIQGDVLPIATMPDGRCWFGKRQMGSGAIWYCGADVTQPDGSFVQDGVALISILSRAIDEGRQTGEEPNSVGWIAGQVPDWMQQLSWRNADADQLGPDPSGPDPWGPDPWGYRAGVFFRASAAGTADFVHHCEVVNCPVKESDRATVPKQQVRRWLPGATWHAIEQDAAIRFTSDSTGQASPRAQGFVRESWASVWILLIVVMLLEAWLSLPRPATRSQKATDKTVGKVAGT